MSLKLPTSLQVRNLMEDLLGREVTVGPADPLVAKNLPVTAVAMYVSNAARLAGVICFELPLAAYASAALGLIPAGGAEDSIEDKELSPVLAENLGELCNVMTSLLNREGQPHVKLDRVYLPGEALPADASALALAFGNRDDLHVKINRYGGGRLSISLA